VVAAALPDVVVSIAFLFVVLFAAMALRPLLVALANQLPLIGGALSSGIDNVINGFLGVMTPLAAPALGVFTNILTWVQSTWSALASTTVGFGQLAYAAVWRISFLTIPNAISTAMSQVGQSIAAGEAYALSLVQADAAAAGQALAGAEAASTAAVAAARGEALSLFQQSESYAGALIGSAEGQAAALFQQAEAAAIGEVGVVTAYVDTRFSQSIAISAAAEAALQGNLNGVASLLGAQLAGGVSALEQEIAAARAALSGQTITAVAAVAADVAAIRAMRCMQVCDPLGAIGEGFQLLDLAIILSLIAGAASDPQGTEQFLSGSLGPVLNGMVADGRSLIGA